MERVIRVRGGGRDENDDPIPGSETVLMAQAVAPGSSPGNKDRGRNGAKVAFTVYFFPAKDLREGDKLRVRGTVGDLSKVFTEMFARDGGVAPRVEQDFLGDAEDEIDKLFGE